MSAKRFYWQPPGVAAALAGERYVDPDPQTRGVLIEYNLSRPIVLQIEAWHGIPTRTRQKIIASLVASGWTEGEQTKPD